MCDYGEKVKLDWATHKFEEKLAVGMSLKNDVMVEVLVTLR
jgi:hypothetical protein